MMSTGSCASWNITTNTERLSGQLRAMKRQMKSGASRDRTDDLLLAKQALSQLSYGPND